MGEKYAVRNIRLCTKDCLCLYVCPTGATDTENSIIDVDKCIGCGECAKACLSAAISMVPKTFPVQQKKDEKTIEALRDLIANKIEVENIAGSLNEPIFVAIKKSARLVSEDLSREAGFMLPQSGNTKTFLKSLLSDDSVPQEIIYNLLNTINFNEEAKKNTKWKCSVCGYIHEGDTPPDVCPVCKQNADKFVKIE